MCGCWRRSCPARLSAVGKNYLDHVQEMGDDAPPEAPVLFLKPSTSVIGDGDYIRLPPDTNMVHHEAELARRHRPPGPRRQPPRTR